MSQTIRTALPEPHYSLFDTERDDMRAVVVVNTAALSFEERNIFPWHLEIVISFTCRSAALGYSTPRMPAPMLAAVAEPLSCT